MTLKDLKERCATAKLTYQYGIIEDKTQAPYLYAITTDSINFIADNKVYKKIDSIELYYIFKVKDIAIEETIEDTILAGVVWRKGEEIYFKDERVWQVIYYFSI